MAELHLLGLFHEATPTAETIAKLHQLGVPDEKITVMSGSPYHHEMLNRPRPRGRVGLISMVGAILGVLTAGFLTAGIFLLYPIEQGGQPIVPIPPSLIILFEVTMLGTMWAAFFGMLFQNRFPIFKFQAYDTHITEGHIGVQVEVEEALAEKVEGIFAANGAQYFQRFGVGPATDPRNTIFWGAVIAAVAIFGVVTLLFFYDILSIPFPTQMLDQDSIGFEQGPRLAAPAESVPIQGPVLIAGQPASQPMPVSPASLQRGQELFSLNCAICHGQGGKGDGAVGAFFTPKPSDLTSTTAQNLPDTQIFLIITQGIGPMPSLAENLEVVDRWDVVNYVHSLKK